MAEIIINEISQNYSYVIGNNSFCTVALPITSSWGPGFFDPDILGKSKDIVLEDTVWQRFEANQSGLESFVTTYRGPVSNYRLAKDYSYQMAMTLMAKGYDVLVCRLCPGNFAESKTLTDSAGGGTLKIKAKYPGTFGNSIICKLSKIKNREAWRFIVYIVDSSGVKYAVENLTFTFDIENSTDTVLQIKEVESDYVTFEVKGSLNESSNFGDDADQIELSGGTDRATDTTAEEMIADAVSFATARYKAVTDLESSKIDYIAALSALSSSADISVASTRKYLEWVYTNVIDVYALLYDKLAYNPQRIISPGWDDQNIKELDEESEIDRLEIISPIHLALMNAGYYSRCGVAYLDTPKTLPRYSIYDDSTEESTQGYAQLLARYVPDNTAFDVDSGLFPTHSTLFGPWGTYKFVGTNRYNAASPSFLALMIQKSMIENQSIQYEWVQPSTRKCNVAVGKLDYTVPKKVLDIWQPDPDTDGGVGVNAICNIPDLGLTIWGDSTLYENPPANYQALRALSVRLLVNAIKNQVYKIGISITYNYNNETAYSKFYVGVTPLLDSMVNAGAIQSYYVRMAEDLDAIGQVKANSCLGKVYIVPNGVINKISVDLICLPPGTDLSEYAQ